MWRIAKSTIIALHDDTPTNSCNPPEEIAFNDHPHPTERTLEQNITATLWRWKFAAPTERDAIVADSEFPLMLEFWFPLDDIPLTRKLGTWCDGITTLEITSNSRCSFSIAGIGYFPTYLAPFELEFHFAKRRDIDPISIVLRLGFRDGLMPANREGPLRMWKEVVALSKRPQRNSDWAVAVELTSNGDNQS